MTDDVNKRMNFFDRQFLRASDFKVEQAYHIDRHQQHNRLMHTPGVAHGLEVEGNVLVVVVPGGPATQVDEQETARLAPNFRTITVGPGTAIDALGREIVLLTPLTVTLPVGPTEAEVYIRLDETFTDPSADPGISGNTRITESPRIIFRQVTPPPLGTPPSDGVLLAAVKLSSGNLADINNNVRLRAGAIANGLSTDQGGSLELGDRFSERTPYIDFHHGGGANEDYDMRIINIAKGKLTVQGGRFGIGTEFRTKTPISPLSPLTVRAITLDQELVGFEDPSGEIKWHINQNLGGNNPGLNFVETNVADGRLFIKAGGDVGIGTFNPEAKLDVRGAIRAGNSDIYFTKTDHNHSTIGNAAGIAAIENAADYNALMILGRTIIGTALHRRVRLWDFLQVNGNLEVLGNLSVTGSKSGYVVNRFVNRLNETVEQGDVIVISENQSSLYYGLNNNIPVPEIDLAQTAYNTRVCGIVCEIHGEMVQEPQEENSDTKSKTTSQAKAKKQSNKAEKLQQRIFTFEEMSALDITKVGSDQIGLMVTLGAFAHCKVDATIAPIQVGDLLTTSPTKGHAQKVLDKSKATGAIIGKALASLKKGKEKIPVLVMLQ